MYAQLYNPEQRAEMEETQQRLAKLRGPEPLPLSSIQKLATDIRQQDFLNQQTSPETFKAALTEAWKSGQLQMVTPPAM